MVVGDLVYGSGGDYTGVRVCVRVLVVLILFVIVSDIANECLAYVALGPVTSLNPVASPRPSITLTPIIFLDSLVLLTSLASRTSLVYVTSLALAIAIVAMVVREG